MTLLDTILEDKKREIVLAKSLISRDQIEAMARDAEKPRAFRDSLRQVPFGIIAEIKKASPTRGVLAEDFDHRKLAGEFAEGGATALSVLTDRKYFQGDATFLGDVKSTVRIPVLRKDFIIDEYQVFESRALGADAVLLIVRALPTGALQSLYEAARSLGMDVLVETHTAEEIERANFIGADLIGINNRDLETFQVSIQTSLALWANVDKRAVAVSESGISSRADVLTLQAAGFKAALVGEGIMTRRDRVAAVKELVLR